MIGAIAGGIAQAYYKKIPDNIISKVKYYLDITLKNVLKEFNDSFNIQY